MIVFSAVGTFILLKLVGLFVPLRMSEKNMEIGDTAEHGHEVYPVGRAVARLSGRDTRARTGCERRPTGTDRRVVAVKGGGPAGATPFFALAQYQLGGRAQRRCVATDEQRRHDRFAPSLQLVADLLPGPDQRQFLD